MDGGDGHRGADPEGAWSGGEVSAEALLPADRGKSLQRNRPGRAEEPGSRRDPPRTPGKPGGHPAAGGGIERLAGGQYGTQADSGHLDPCGILAAEQVQPGAAGSTRLEGGENDIGGTG